MSKVKVNGVELHYESFGEGPETLVFSHGFLMNHTMFAAQIEALKQDFRIIAYDHRGHGQSQVVRRPYGIYDLMRDGAGVIDALADGPVHFVGMSTGGYVGMRLMLRRPDLLKSVVLIDTSAGAEPFAGRLQYDVLLEVVRWFGFRPVLNKALSMLMGETFRTDMSRRAEYDRWVRSIRRLDRQGIYRFGKAIFGRDSVAQALEGHSLPALVIVGEKDVPTPPRRAAAIAAALPNARLCVIPDAGHTSPVEAPALVSQALVEFFGELRSSESSK